MPVQHTITTTCPSCSQSFDVDASMLGRKGRCENCGSKFIIEPTVAPPIQAQPNKASSHLKTAALALVGLIILGGLFWHYTNSQPAAPSQADSPEKPTTESEPPVITSESIPKKDVSQKPPLTPPATPKSPTEKTLVADPKQPEPAKADETFPVKTAFEKIDIRQYRRTYPPVHQGWMPSRADQAQEALRWSNYLGPLGVQARSHVPQLQSRPAFAANVPPCIRTQNGELGLTAAEVMRIAPGSPAENHLRAGDLIIGIEGEMLLSGNAYRPDWKFMHKDARELQLMLGEKIDAAQSRGNIRLTVLRYPKSNRSVLDRRLRAADGIVTLNATKVSAGDEIHLIVEPNGLNEGDHVAWLQPVLSGPKGKIQLADANQIKPQQATTGWGKLTYGKDLTGKALPKPGFTVHATSRVVFVVPDGYDQFETQLLACADKADVQAKIEILTPQKALPVSRTELWSGKGGNQSTGLQDFNIELKHDGYITLESHSFDNSIHGDGTAWLDVTLEGDYGKKQLFNLTPEYAQAGYGRAQFTSDKAVSYHGKSFQQSLNLHAHGSAKWKLPKGTRRIRGTFAAISHGKVQPKIHFTNHALPLTGIHQQKVVEVQFPIGKTGSFSKTYPRDCAKTDLMVQRHTNWLAAQQRDDGSWPRLAGYTTSGWDTAFCALALMSSGEAKYDTQVRKAAFYIGYETAPSEWTAERAMRLIFLSEYYLRTQDAKILAAVQAAYYQLLDCCKTDYMAGHKVNGFGYGIAGQHYGTGHLVLAMAVASRTRITTHPGVVENIIRHGGEVCVNGTYAYGRGRRMARDETRQHGGGNAMSGPGLLGVQIGGGHQSAIKEFIERMDASIGDGDNSHATSSLAFIFASLALAAADEEVFLKHMQNFRYKLTLDDNWEGGFLKSAFPLDFQGGEGVTSNWIRSAGTILVLNALKNNLAITGRKDFWAEKYLTTTAVSEWGGQVHSYYLRNWCIVKELLGRHSPREINMGIQQMHKLPRTTDLVPQTRDVILKLAPGIIKKIANNSFLNSTQRAYAIELICGLDFKIHTEMKNSSQVVQFHVNLPLHQLNWLDSDKATLFTASPFPLKSKIEVSGSNLSERIVFETDGTKGCNLDQGTIKKSHTKALKNPSQKQFDGVAKISFQLGKTRISYQRPLKFNTPFSHSNNYNLRRMKLRLKVAPRAYFQSQPLIIAGIPFDCMYPAERMLDIQEPEDGMIVHAHEGDEVIADIASENMICAWVHSLEFQKATQVRIAQAREHRTITGTLKGNPTDLYDHNPNTACDLVGASSKTVIEYDFGKPVTLNGLDAHFSGSCFIRVWYHNGTRWIPLVWDRYSVSTGHHPTFPATKSDRWRVEMQIGRSKKFGTLRFYYNPNRVLKNAALPQSKDEKFAPLIEPQ